MSAFPEHDDEGPLEGWKHISEVLGRTLEQITEKVIENGKNQIN